MIITQYASVIVDERNSYELGELVNVKIKEGFQPYGFPILAPLHGQKDQNDQSEFIIVQAMVKYAGGDPGTG